MLSNYNLSFVQYLIVYLSNLLLLDFLSGFFISGSEQIIILGHIRRVGWMSQIAESTQSPITLSKYCILRDATQSSRLLSIFFVPTQQSCFVSRNHGKLNNIHRTRSGSAEVLCPVSYRRWLIISSVVEVENYPQRSASS